MIHDDDDDDDDDDDMTTTMAHSDGQRFLDNLMMTMIR